MEKNEGLSIRARIFNPVVGIWLVLVGVYSFVPVFDVISGREPRFDWVPYVFGGGCAAVIFFSGLSVTMREGKIAVKKLYFFIEEVDFAEISGWRQCRGRPAGGGLPIPRIEIFVRGREIPIMIPIKPFRKTDVEMLKAALLELLGEQIKI